MGSRLLSVAFGAHDPERLGVFWAYLLGRRSVADDRGVLLPGAVGQVGLRFPHVLGDRPTEARMHLHVTSDGDLTQEETVQRALALGARREDVGQKAGEGHVVLADVEGNAFCVIERGNSYLAECGLLGEVTCDGTRDVGLFWSAALGWPLVWDERGETAVQSPVGGTKVAWGGASVARVPLQPWSWFELKADRMPWAEADRLVSLGAATHAPEGDLLWLVDPDGNPFCLHPQG